MKRLAFAVSAVLVAACAFADEVQDYRELSRRYDFEAIIRAAETSMPAAPEARAIYVRALSRTLGGDARSAAQALRRDHPNDPWSWYAFALSSDQTVADYDNFEPATAKMMELAKSSADNTTDEMISLRAAALSSRGKFDEALALVDGKASPMLLSSKASLLLMQSWTKKDDSLAAKALALYEEVRKLDSTFIEGYVRAAQQLRHKRRNEEAHALLKQAAALTPGLSVHREYWMSVRADKSIAEEAKRPEIDADIAALLKQRGDWIPVLAEIANEYSAQKREEEAEALRRRVLAEAPRSRYAQTVLYSRYNAFRRAAGPKLLTDPDLKAKNLKMIRDFIAWPSHPDANLLAQMYMSYFSAVNREPDAVMDEEMLKIVRGMEPLGEETPTIVYGRGGMALATRGFALDEAEKIVRDGIYKVDKYIANNRLTMANDPVDAEMERFENATRSEIRDALGWVLLKRGRAEEAKTQLLAAYEYYPDNMFVLYHLGQYHEGRSQLDKAEDFYRRGATKQTPDVNPNRDALKTLYGKRHGSLVGFDDYLRTLNDRDAAKRRRQILTARHKSPRAVPPFSLRSLDGKKVALADLKGKIAVINFWGVWCGWCVREMPDYQRLAQKYAKDPKVAILTINNDNDDPKVKKWMAEQQYDFFVLLDDGFVGRSDIHGFPTTWFVDPAGRLAFEKRGWSEKLLEEFSWRVEDLRVGDR